MGLPAMLAGGVRLRAVNCNAIPDALSRAGEEAVMADEDCLMKIRVTVVAF